MEVDLVVLGRVNCTSPNPSGFLQRGIPVSLDYRGESQNIRHWLSPIAMLMKLLSL